MTWCQFCLFLTPPISVMFLGPLFLSIHLFQGWVKENVTWCPYSTPPRKVKKAKSANRVTPDMNNTLGDVAIFDEMLNNVILVVTVSNSSKSSSFWKSQLEHLSTLMTVADAWITVVSVCVAISLVSVKDESSCYLRCVHRRDLNHWKQWGSE